MNNLEVKRGDIFYGSIDGVGSEQQGKKLLLVIQNDIGNKFSPTIIVVPITSQIKAKLPTHVRVVGNGLDKESTILCEQIRVIDKRRIINKIGHLEEYIMEKVDKATCISLKLGETEKERLAREKALEVEKIEFALATLNECKTIDKDVFEGKLRERKLYLDDLISFCELNKLNYRNYYKMYKTEQKIAV